MIGTVAEMHELDVSRETYAKLEQYVERLTEESERQNLVSKLTLPDVWQRHVADAAQLLAFAPSNGSWLDIGSGAGLPGLIIAIISGNPMVLIEPRRLRAEFLRKTADALDLGPGVEVVQSKVEQVRHAAADIITARAVASVDRIFAMAEHLSHRGTIWILPKGRSAKSELDAARQTWQGDFRLEASRTDPEAKILIATGVRRKSRPRGVA